MPATSSTLRQKIVAFTNTVRIPWRPAFSAALVISVVSVLVALFFWWKENRLAETLERAGVESPHAITEASPGSKTESIVESASPERGAPANDSSVVLALNDAGGRVTLDARGNVGGLGSLPQPSQQAVKQALTSGRVDVPSLSDWIGKKGTLLGTDQDDAFSLLSPVGAVTRSSRPTLRWRPLRGASSYTVGILDADFNAVETSPSLTSSSWTPPRALERGRVYSWQVTAVKDGKEIISPTPPAPEAKFKVLEKAKADELSNVERVADSHLARGILYAQAGLPDEAELEFRALVADNPKSPIARKLLQNVQAIRSTRKGNQR